MIVRIALHRGVISIPNSRRDGDVLVVIEVLAELLEPAVQVAYVHRARQDPLAVQLQHVAQRGVRGRMLRTEVENPNVPAGFLLRVACTLGSQC